MMTKEQFFSPTLVDWIKDVNEKHPHMSNEEFCKLFESWFDDNKDNMVLNESVDLTKYPRLIVESDDFDDFVDYGDDEEEHVSDDEDVDDIPSVKSKPESTRKTAIEDEDDEFGEFDGGDEGEDEDGDGVFKDVEGGGEEVKEKPIVIKPASTEDAEKLSSKIKGKYLVNNGKDYEHNIFSVVNAWYDECIRSGSGENTLENNRITLLDTGLVEDMRALFAFANVPNLDLSGWDTSAVRTMEGMFYKSTFDNKSIEGWDVSSCANFKNMFESCRFSGDISGWDPARVPQTVYDDFGKPKMVEDLDASGKPKRDPRTGHPVYKIEKVWVPAELPEVGNRKHGINDAKNKRILAALRDLDAADKEREDKKKEDRLMSHVEEQRLSKIMDFDTFVNEGFIDSVKSGFKKIKDAIVSFATKIGGYYIAIFNKNGEAYKATSKYTTINYIAGGNVPGVQVFNPSGELVNDNVESTANLKKKEGYYDFIRPGSREYKNFLTFCDMVGGKTNIMEARMPLGSTGSGVDGVPDIGSDMLKSLMKEMLREAPAYKRPGEESKTLLIFGAPGIGKSSIPKSIIDAYNEEPGHEGKKKTLLTIECGDLSLDGFYLPIPRTETLKDKILERPKIIKDLGLSSETIDKFKNTKVLNVVEAPKTWLPVYEPSTDRDVNVASNAIANGRILEKMVWDEKLGESIPVAEETTEGGIIMFDEFLRADPEIFKILMQIILNRRLADGKRFGSKWAFICCSNRPVDDEEVSRRYENLSAAAATRFLKGVYNFIPDFYDWKKWAETEGHFDEYTLAFIAKPDAKNRDEYKVHSYSGEKTATAFLNWHNVDVEDKRNFISPMPRTWAALMDDINSEIKNKGVDSILDLSNDWIRTKAISIIGEDTGNRYADYLKDISERGGIKVKDMMSDGSVDIDTEAHGANEVYKVVVGFLNTHYYRRDGDVKLPTDKELFNLAKNMDRLYGKSEGSYVTAMHNDIIRSIFKIRSTDTAIIKKIPNYLKIVGKKYGVDFVDDKPIDPDNIMAMISR